MTIIKKHLLSSMSEMWYVWALNRYIVQTVQHVTIKKPLNNIEMSWKTISCWVMPCVKDLTPNNGCPDPQHWQPSDKCWRCPYCKLWRNYFSCHYCYSTCPCQRRMFTQSLSTEWLNKHVCWGSCIMQYYIRAWIVFCVVYIICRNIVHTLDYGSSKYCLKCTCTLFLPKPFLMNRTNLR